MANEVVTEACPVAFSVWGVPICVVPLKNVTVPLGVPPTPDEVDVIVTCDPTATVVPAHPFVVPTATTVVDGAAIGKKLPPKANDDVNPLVPVTARVPVKAPGIEGVACTGSTQSVVLSVLKVQLGAPSTKLLAPAVSV